MLWVLCSVVHGIMAWWIPRRIIEKSQRTADTRTHAYTPHTPVRARPLPNSVGNSCAYAVRMAISLIYIISITIANWADSGILQHTRALTLNASQINGQLLVLVLPFWMAAINDRIKQRHIQLIKSSWLGFFPRVFHAVYIGVAARWLARGVEQIALIKLILKLNLIQYF